jgi:3-deoxy-manno-octulosonate cytidylyltransferase (CMP-KDO synthetase)
MKSLGIIPARYASTRFPGKPLAMIGNKSMIQRVYEQAIQSKLDRVMVATDDQRIFDHVISFGGLVMMTSVDHTTGTERCAEATMKISETFDLVINIQGDEPFIDPRLLNLIIGCFDTSGIEIATAARKIDTADDLISPNVVKVVTDDTGKALYFSRSPIPYLRNTPQQSWTQHHTYFSHIGIYAYRTEILKKLIKLPAHPLEQAESLEQLRWLVHGFTIKVVETHYQSISIDTPEDLAKAEAYLSVLPPH